MTCETKAHRDGEGEKVILTGGTEGIGRAMALELAEQGHRLVICARTRERLKEMGAKKNIHAIQLDLGDADKIADFVRRGSDRLGGVTILILNAAVTGIRESKEYTFKVVRDAQKALVDSAAPVLRASNGRIVFLASSQAQKFIEGHEHYGQAKKDVEEWLLEFSIKPENKGVRVMLVNPGHVGTRMNEEAIRYGRGAIRERSVRAKNEGRFRDPSWVGRIIAKMALGGMKFNPENNQYDLLIGNNEIVAITDQNVEFEKNWK